MERILRHSSRALIESLLLYVGFVLLYCLHIETIPAKLEGFEEWVNANLPRLDLTGKALFHNLVRIDANDSNCSVTSPPWFYTIKASLWLVGDRLAAYRIPGILLSAFVPVLAAAIIRRFIRPEWAFLIGILVGTNQHVMWFARTGGYIGPTFSLFLLIVYLGFIIASENKRWPWIPLSGAFILLPFFYATIRYHFFIAMVPLSVQLLRSSEFRRKQLIPMVSSVVIVLGILSPLARGSVLDTLVAFYDARGEQFLVKKEIIKNLEPVDDNPLRRLDVIFGEVVPQRANDLITFYYNGRRFFNPRHQELHMGLWKSIRPGVLSLFALGALYCLIKGLKNPRFFMPLIWLVIAVVPLFVTTGIYPGRLLMVVPSDVFMLFAGTYIVATAPTKLVGPKYGRIFEGLVWLLVFYVAYYQVVTYFQDYITYGR